MNSKFKGDTEKGLSEFQRNARNRTLGACKTLLSEPGAKPLRFAKKGILYTGQQCNFPKYTQGLQVN